MSVPLASLEVLNREFPEIRAWLLQIGAALDRMDRGFGSVTDDPRRQSVDEALRLLLAAGADRAEQIQLLFSLPYDPNWKQEFAMPQRS
jgi:hypothetical protein